MVKSHNFLYFRVKINNFKIRLLKVICISILLYGCDTSILTETLIEKLDIYASTCYRIVLGIKQSRDHVTNQSLYQLTGQAPLRESIESSSFAAARHKNTRLKKLVFRLTFKRQSKMAKSVIKFITFINWQPNNFKGCWYPFFLIFFK